MITQLVFTNIKYKPLWLENKTTHDSREENGVSLTYSKILYRICNILLY